MHRRPETRVLAFALIDIGLSAIFIGSPRATVLEHLIGCFSAFGGARAWRRYWTERDRHTAWIRRRRR